MDYEQNILKNGEDIEKAINALSKNLKKNYSGSSIDIISLNHAPRYFTLDLSRSLNMDIRIQKLEFENSSFFLCLTIK